MSLLGLPFFSRPHPRRLRWLRVITGFAWCCGGTRSLRAGSGPSPREPPAAAAEARLAVGPVSASDMGALERQLGYRPYPLAVGARCVHGHPQAFVWDPLARFHGGRARRAPLDSGLFRLSCPLLVQAVDRWEAEGAVRQLQAEVDEGRVSECSRADLEEANRRHALARRALVGSRLEEALQRSREADAAAPPPPPPRRKRTGAGAKSGARPPRALSREELSELVLNSGVAGQSPSKPEVKCLHAQLADHLCRDHSNPLGEAILSGVAARGVAVHGDSQCHQQCDCGVAREAATWWYTPVKNKQKLFTRLERRKQRQVARLEAAEEGGGGGEEEGGSLS